MFAGSLSRPQKLVNLRPLTSPSDYKRAPCAGKRENDEQTDSCRERFPIPLVWTCDADERAEITEPAEAHQQHENDPTHDDPRIQVPDQCALDVFRNLRIPGHLSLVF